MDILNELKSMKATISKVASIKADNTDELSSLSIIDDVIKQASKQRIFSNQNCLFKSKAKNTQNNEIIHIATNKV